MSRVWLVSGWATNRWEPQKRTHAVRAFRTRSEADGFRVLLSRTAQEWAKKNRRLAEECQYQPSARASFEAALSHLDPCVDCYGQFGWDVVAVPLGGDAADPCHEIAAAEERGAAWMLEELAGWLEWATPISRPLADSARELSPTAVCAERRGT